MPSSAVARNRDGRVDDVVASIKIDVHERLQGADCVRWVGATVKGARLEYVVSDGSSIARGVDVVIAQSKNIGSVRHPGAYGSGGNSRVPC